MRHGSTRRALKRKKILDGIVENNEPEKKGGRAVTSDGLTVKQEGFALEVAKGSTLADAYRSSYDTGNMNDATIYSEASKLMDNPRVAARVSRLIDQRSNGFMAIDRKRTRQYVFDGLMRESSDTDNPPAVRVRALELLGKIDDVGMFGGQQQLTDTDRMSADDIERMLREKLGAMFRGT